MYYPDQRYISKLTTIRRECLLPEEAIGSIRVQDGARVDVRDVVAHGAVPARHVILDGQRFFGLKKTKDLDALMQVKVGDAVDDGDVLAGKNPQRGKRLFSPLRGIVTRVDDGKIILQEMPEIIDLAAGVRGRVIEVYSGRGVAVEAVGAVAQGVWGNGRRVIAPLRMEPENGLEFIRAADELDAQYRGSIVVTRSTLQESGLAVVENQNLAGIIAPSMDAHLRERMLQSEIVIMLTEGFGTMRMSAIVLNLLNEFDGHQVTLDAHTPRSWEPRCPEVIAGVQADERPPRPNFMLALRPGMSVRITRAPFAGQVGKIVNLPKNPVLLDNGLRVPGAQVELIGGEIKPIPLANIEVTGR